MHTHKFSFVDYTINQGFIFSVNGYSFYQSDPYIHVLQTTYKVTELAAS